MAADINGELISYLTAIQAIEQQGLRLLMGAIKVAGDQRMADMYRTHCLQTEAHVRTIIERLEAHDPQASLPRDTAHGLEALGIRIVSDAPGGSAATLAMATYAFENLEIAAYHLLRGVAERAGDADTIAAIDRILEEEEQAAETLASTFDRALEISLGEAPRTATNVPRPERSVGDAGVSNG